MPPRKDSVQSYYRSPSLSCMSRALTETEQRYSNIERELLAIVFALKRLNHYTFGRIINSPE